MIKNKLYIFFALAFLFSCIKEKQEPIVETNDSVSFKLMLKSGDKNFFLGDTISYDKYKVLLSDFNFYISDLCFYQGIDSVLLDSILLFDFKVFDQFKINQLSFKRLPVYDSLTFGIGVQQRMNGTLNPDFNVLDYPIGHPLSPVSSGMYWSWAEGFRFVLYDGYFSNNGSNNLINPISIHTGPDKFYRTFSKVMNTSSIDSLILRIDMMNILNNQENGFFDLDKYNQYHGFNNQTETATLFSDNFINSISVEVK